MMKATTTTTQIGAMTMAMTCLWMFCTVNPVTMRTSPVMIMITSANNCHNKAMTKVRKHLTMYLHFYIANLLTIWLISMMTVQTHGIFQHWMLRINQQNCNNIIKLQWKWHHHHHRHSKQQLVATATAYSKLQWHSEQWLLQQIYIKTSKSIRGDRRCESWVCNSTVSRPEQHKILRKINNKQSTGMIATLHCSVNATSTDAVTAAHYHLSWLLSFCLGCWLAFCCTTQCIARKCCHPHHLWLIMTFFSPVGTSPADLVTAHCDLCCMVLYCSGSLPMLPPLSKLLPPPPAPPFHSYFSSCKSFCSGCSVLTSFLCSFVNATTTTNSIVAAITATSSWFTATSG